MAALNTLSTDEKGMAHNQLRHATHEYHVRLNRHPMLAGLMQPEYSLARYQNLLAAYFYIYQILEDKITRYLESQVCKFDYAQRCKLPWLRQSIAFFGEDSLLDFTPKKTLVVPDIENLGELIGVLYVIEGATLGGQHIFKSLAKQYSFFGDDGVRFFQGYGDQTSQNWYEFLHFSDSISGCADLCSAAAHSAVQVFQFFENVLDEFA